MGTNQIKTAHLVLALEHGGLEQIVIRLTKARNNIALNSSIIICLDAKGSLSENISPDNLFCVHADRSKKPWDQRAVIEIKKILKLHNIKILHSHNLATMQYAVLAKFGNKNIKHVYTQHGENAHILGIKGKLRGMILTKFPDKIVAVSHSVKQSIKKSYWVADSHISVINNGVESHFNDSSLNLDVFKKDIGISSDDIVIGSVARLSYVKGWDIFFPIFKQILEGFNKNVVLLLIGNGPERYNLEKLSTKLRLDKNIIFLGFQSKPMQYVNIMDFFILPSRSEGMSISLLEAMAMAKPVFVTDVGENKKIIQNGLYGFLLPKERSLWNQIIIDKITNMKDAEAIGVRALKYVTKNFLFNSSLEAYEICYKNSLFDT